jgi:chemotaxis protein MotB
MSKKHKHEEHENHERWLVSYADFITLLFAFFVVMYSVSSVNEGKFRTVSDSIKAALNPISSQPVSSMRFDLGDHKAQLAESIDKKVIFIRKFQKGLRKHSAVKADLSQAVLPNGMSVNHGDRTIVLTLSDNLLFESGQTVLKEEAYPVLEAFAEVLNEYGMGVHVEGHTDNVPVSTAQFASNWELSAVRSASVARVLTEVFHVPPDQVAATGYGEFKPVADNLTPENRGKNRRVELVVTQAHAGRDSVE